MNDYKEKLTTQLKNVKSQVKIADYAEKTLRKAKAGNKYVCPACNSGGHNLSSSNSAFSIHGEKFYCHSCQKYGDIFDLAGYVNNTDDKTEQLKIVADFGHVRIEDIEDEVTNYRPTQTASPSHGAKENATDAQKLTANRDKERAKLEQWQKDIQNEAINAPAVAYLKKRGFTLTDAVTHGVGYDKDRRRVVIPCKGNNFYHFDRAIDEAAKVKHIKPKSDEVGAQPLYNSKALKEKCVLIVEGEFDALTLHVLGFNNVIMTGGGTACLQDVTERIKDQPVKPLFVLLFDTDEKGAQFGNDAVAALERIGAVAKDASKDIFIHGKDANEEFTADRDALKSNLTAYCEKALKTLEQDKKEAYRRTLERYNIVSLANSHQRIYTQEGIGEPIPTGFQTLDAKLNGGFHAKQLITIGAISSFGKTSLCLQIAHNIAANGTPVLFVSIEQSALEIDAKLLSMYTLLMEGGSTSATPYFKMLQKDPSRLTGKRAQQLECAINNLDRNLGDRLHVQECETRPTVAEIKEIATVLAEHEGIAPVVFVDYLQLLAPVNERDQERQIVDKNLTELKHIANTLNTPVIIISSFNRQSYNAPAEFTSFKESGAIEYSCDVVLGLQSANAKQADRAHTKKDDKRDAVKRQNDESKNNDVTDVALTILKQRNGLCDTNGIRFTFNKPYSCFNETGKPFELKQDIHIF